MPITLKSAGESGEFLPEVAVSKEMFAGILFRIEIDCDFVRHNARNFGMNKGKHFSFFQF